MASEYWKWKFRDVQPEEKVELTPKQKRRNWWHYHKWYVILGAVGAAALLSVVLTMLGVGRTFPDYQFAYVADFPLPDDAAAALENALATLGEDCNGDGKVKVQLNQYAAGGDAETANPYYVMAATAKIMADISGEESYFFLLEDPEEFQRSYSALRRLDGSLPAEGDPDWESCVLKWSDCPALAALDLGGYEEALLTQAATGESQSLFANLYIARRGFWTEKTCDYAEECDALWEQITKGAIS